ncbi:MAG: hypothetical protein EHM66_00300 [Deltaproteobacteria bacterium]|nr:MAG: hypothetical protein EHM66_00300 [Deltaproteobacteria bacterium]
MSPRRAALAVSYALAFWALLIFVCLARPELPAGMHRASFVRVDTLIDFVSTPASAWLDSVARADSLKIEKRKQ